MELYQLRNFVAVAEASHQLVRALFDQHRIEPTKVVETDQEFVIANLVASGARAIP